MKTETFQCVAQLTKKIESIDPESITTGVIGHWSSGKPVQIVGKRLCKTVLGNFYAVRWLSGTGNGLFGKGLAYYNYAKNHFPHLPAVK